MVWWHCEPLVTKSVCDGRPNAPCWNWIVAKRSHAVRRVLCDTYSFSIYDSTLNSSEVTVMAIVSIMVRDMW